MNGMILMLFVTTLDFCLPSTRHLWPHWHHWPKIFNSTSCFPWQHYIVTLSPDVSQYFVACAFILSYLRNPLPLDTWTRGQQTLALQSCPAGIRVAWWVLRALRPRDHLHQKQCGNVHYSSLFRQVGNFGRMCGLWFGNFGNGFASLEFQDHFGQAFFSLQPCCKPNIPWLQYEKNIWKQNRKSTSKVSASWCLVLPRIFVFVSILEETFTNSDLEDGIKSCRLLAMHVSCPFFIGQYRALLCLP